MSLERRKQLFDSLGKNLVGYEQQLRFYDRLLFKTESIRFLHRILFMTADLCVSIRAELLCEDLYARRFYLKRLWINLVEAYKALYHSESNKHSYIAQLIHAYPQLQDNKEFVKILVNLKTFGFAIDKVIALRNSFTHYDEDVWQTIRNLEWINSEETPSQLCCQLLSIFETLQKLVQDMLFEGKIDLYVPQQNDVPSFIAASLIKYLVNNQSLALLLDSIPFSATKRICSNKQAYQFMTSFEGNNVLPLIEASTFIQLIRGDLACSLKACLVSGTRLEAMANLRMSVISEFEGYKHLVNIYPSATKVLEVLSEDARNYNVHYRYQSEDYIPKMYQSYYNLSFIDKFLQMIDFLNDLNKLQELLTIDLKNLSANKM